jgi:hypothetical protein
VKWNRQIFGEEPAQLRHAGKEGEIIEVAISEAE